MLVFTQNLTLPTIKTTLLITVLFATAQLMAGCDLQSSSSNNDITAQTDDVHKSKPEDNKTPINPAPIKSATADKAPAIEVSKLSNDKTVTPAGYQKLSFGQVITPELLNELGLTKAETDNEQCYYVSNPAVSYTDKEYGKRASVLYQMINNKVALITIQAPNIPFYTDIYVGDSVSEVMKAHNNELTYEVDKYALNGDYYSLIANVNFKVIKEPQLGESLKDNNIELNGKEDKLPIQIEYHIKGGQRLNGYRIKSTEWTADNRSLLKGEVESIDIGIPEAIYLVEGCS
ncbi:hypothetical protein [Psychrobacter sp. ANT_WB68]|uniref:hypothetical protein n=1 Tax=Psychrobacter sp. ANT_WB68 TaxID=2597355 RepID=UPI0011F3A9C5|nr:hypothetical protein [Psychrobacter sp. ANT_WB68]KAA0914505.1 hypothetical protein FQ084_08040 [Psychrobacter sp. ANT_WB68]